MSSDKDASIRVVTAMPLTAMSIGIFWLSSIPELVAPDLGFAWQDKLLHATAYTFYGMAAVIFAIGWTSGTLRTVITTVFLIAGLFAISDEIHQYFVPGRDSDVLDVVADLVGITISLTTIPIARKLFA